MPVQKELAEKALALKRGRSVDEFAEVYGIGRSSVYEEIRAGRLKARKIGKRTIIADEDGEDWFAQLPRVRSAAAAA